MTTALHADRLRRYLTTEGWSLVDVGAQGETWMLNEAAPAVLVPTDPSDRDYQTLLESAVYRLALVSGEPFETFSSSLREAASDELEMRIVDDTTTGGRINLERGKLAVTALYEVLVNGARLWAQGGQVLYAGDWTAEIRSVVERYELAAPTVGSFTLTAVSPAPLKLPLEGEGHVDEQRLALNAAVWAVENARRAAEHAEMIDDVDDLEEWVFHGLSANLLKALRAIDTQSSSLFVDMSIRWADGPAPNLPSRVRLEPRHLSQFERMESLLRRQEPRPDYELSGLLKVLSAADREPTQPLSGVVSVQADIDGRVRSVQVEVSDATFLRARGGVGERFLQAVGTLEKVGRTWRLRGARDIRIVEPPAGWQRRRG